MADFERLQDMAFAPICLTSSVWRFLVSMLFGPSGGWPQTLLRRPEADTGR